MWVFFSLPFILIYKSKIKLQNTIVRKVKLILGWTMFLDLGKLCNQFLCVAAFIISKLPCSSTNEIICLVCLCLNKGYKNILLLQSKSDFGLECLQVCRVGTMGGYWKDNALFFFIKLLIVRRNGSKLPAYYGLTIVRKVKLILG